jgi:hypothetical protein
MSDPNSIALRARQALAELALAARSGPVGPTTILAYTARINRDLVFLAEYEAVADELAIEAQDAHRATQAALAAGTVIAFPTRPKLYTGTGGTAA